MTGAARVDAERVMRALSPGVPSGGSWKRAVEGMRMVMPKNGSSSYLVKGLGFGVWGLGFGVWGLGFGVWGLVQGLGFEFRV